MIVMGNCKETVGNIRTNDVPAGTTFQGTLVSVKDGSKYTGVWLAIGKYNIGEAYPNAPVCIRLFPPEQNKYHQLFVSCSEVLGYEPVDVKLTVVPKS